MSRDLEESGTQYTAGAKPSGWQRWLRQPQLLAWRRFVVQLHLWIGLALGLYIVLSISDHREARRREPLDRERHIAELEAQLGIPPATRGNCLDCAKPLQLDAHFCAYCRTPVVPKLRICPSCAATALPDAAWCPKCGMALDRTTTMQA